MSEKEISPGLFITPITRERWLQRTDVLKGEDLKWFIESCNRFIETDILIKHIIGMTRDEFLGELLNIEPNFNPTTDYYVLRYQPKQAVRD